MTSVLDLHTVHVEHAVLLGTLTVLTTVNSVAHRGERGARWFAGYTFAAFLGSVLAALRGSIPDPLSIVGGCLLFSLAYTFLHLSVTDFFDRGSALLRPQLLLVGLAALALVRWGWIHPSTLPRLAIYSILLGLQLSLTTMEVLRQIPGSRLSIRWASGMMAGILGLLTLNNFVRLFILLHHGAPASYLLVGNSFIVTLLVTSVLQGAATVAFVWMTAARLHEELRVEATTDPLTRLLNRRALAAWAQREIALSHQNGWPLAAILLDLDDFKAINDAFGHLCGDAVLLQVADLLSNIARPGDQIGRLGGDEFILLLPRTPEEVALSLGEQLQQSIQSLLIPFGSSLVPVNASFGVTELGGLGLSWEQLVQRCDTALYQAKSLGGNCVLSY